MFCLVILDLTKGSGGGTADINCPVVPLEETEAAANSGMLRADPVHVESPTEGVVAARNSMRTTQKYAFKGRGHSCEQRY